MSNSGNLDLTDRRPKRPAADSPCLTVVIPCFNEQDTVAEAVNRVLDKDSVAEVVIVDDASTDRSWDVISQFSDPRIRLARHSFNLGKGAAIALGISLATSRFTVIQDADLEYNPDEFDLMLEPLLTDRADVVYGSRFHTDRPHRVLYYWHSVGNKLLTIASNMASNVNLTDMETCYKMARTDLMQSLDLREDRFGVEPEMTLKLARRGARIYEVGISYDGRTYEEGKKIGWRDGVRALYCIIKYRLVGGPVVEGGEFGQTSCELSDNELSGLLIDLRTNNTEGAGLPTAFPPTASRLDGRARVAVQSMVERVHGSGGGDVAPVFALDLSGGRAHQRRVLDGVVSSLEPGERLILIIPTVPSLWPGPRSERDERHRVHTASSLRRLIASSGLVVDDISFGNPLDAVERRIADLPGSTFGRALHQLVGDERTRRLAARLGRRLDLTSNISLVCVSGPKKS